MAVAKRRFRGAAFELLAVVAGFVVLTVVFTYPLAFNLGTLGYKLHVVGDYQYSVWNVAWVAHALVTDPLNVFNANIFFPHNWTLIYSEANLLGGALGVPVYLLTRNAYATHNFVVLLSFVLSGTGTYYLVRYITEDRRAAMIAAIAFAYCPYVFGHLPHIQLLMTAGIPFSLLAFHRLADAPSAGRGMALGLAMGLQGLACAYYAVFVALIIGFSVVSTAATRGWWRNGAYWRGVLAGAAVAIAIVAPLFLPYVLLQRDTGFARALEESRRYAANLVSYVTSAMYFSDWLRGGSNAWTDVLFPGFLAATLGIAGYWMGRAARGPWRYYAGLYGAITALAFWLSFGPKAGLYTVTYYALPAFSFLRAPSRFGIVVTLGLSVLAGIAMARLFSRHSRLTPLLVCALLAFELVESAVPVPWTPNPEIPQVYRELAQKPAGALLELPVYSRGHNYGRTRYMLASTVHWKPLVNAYSDLTPASFSNSRDALASFPSVSAFEHIPEGVRYAIFHLEEYEKNGVMEELEASIEAYSPYLRQLYADKEQRLYEIVGTPFTVAQSQHSPSTRTDDR